MIDINNITKHSKKQNILDNVTLQINQGDKIALLGANGAGKTTLIRSILGHYHVKGDISFSGQSIHSNRVNILSNIACAPQHAPPLPMTVKHLVRINSQIHPNLAENQVWHLAQSFGIDKDKDYSKPFTKLSGGMQQKLLVALALAKRPKILIMDEPTANLDIEGREFLLQELAKFPKEAIFILTSHRINELLPIINRIIEMDFGRIITDKSVNISNSRNAI